MKKLIAGVPLDQITVPEWLPWAATRMKLRIGATISGSLKNYGLPTPPHAPGESHPVQSQTIRDRLAAGKITVKPGISRLESDRVVFTDGTSTPADLIVWATGYKVTFPFFDEDFLAAKDNNLPLWHRAVHPDHDGLYFIGLLQPVGAVMPLAESQSRMVAELLSGKYSLPSKSQMRREMDEEHRAYLHRFYQSARHTMEVDFDGFLWKMKGEMKRGRERAANASKVNA